MAVATSMKGVPATAPWHQVHRGRCTSTSLWLRMRLPSQLQRLEALPNPLAFAGNGAAAELGAKQSHSERRTSSPSCHQRGYEPASSSIHDPINARRNACWQSPAGPSGGALPVHGGMHFRMRHARAAAGDRLLFSSAICRRSFQSSSALISGVQRFGVSRSGFYTTSIQRSMCSPRSLLVTMSTAPSSSSFPRFSASSSSSSLEPLVPDGYDGKAGLVFHVAQPDPTELQEVIARLEENAETTPDAAAGLTLSSGAWALPHPEKLARGGEDAHFIGKDCVGVADGVGGWADMGVDPGIYSKALMAGVSAALEQEGRVAMNPDERPVAVMREAHTQANRTARGSTTACFAYLERGGDGASVVKLANLGDSTLYLIRRGRLAFKTPQQQHGFNFPFQLGSEASDTADMADVFEFDVRRGDIIVLGTDGLSDNVFDEDIVSIVWEGAKMGLSPGELARDLTLKAKADSMSLESVSPFSAAAAEAGLSFPGGKPDDITVTVSFAVKKERDEVAPQPRL